MRDALWQSSDWSQTLQELASDLQRAPANPEATDPATLLARAFEAIEPDRSHAVRMYFWAWNADPRHPELLTRAHDLCRESGNLEMAARLARLRFQDSHDPLHAFAEGVAWLDANQPEQAVAPLLEARKSIPESEPLRIALATAMGEWGDPRETVASLAAEADRLDGQSAAERFLCAARIVRIGGSRGETYGELLRYGFRANPDHASIYGLLEDWLIERGERDELLETYRRRTQSTQAAATLVEEYRRAGTKLVLTGYLRGLGLRLLERAVACAHESGLESIPGHIASLSLIKRHADEANLQPQLLEHLARGLERRLPDYDLLWMAMTGLDICWGSLGDRDTSRGYAAIVAELAPEHPLLVNYNAATASTNAKATTESNENNAGVFLDEWIASADEVIRDVWPPRKIGLAAAFPDADVEPPAGAEAPTVEPDAGIEAPTAEPNAGIEAPTVEPVAVDPAVEPPPVESAQAEAHTSAPIAVEAENRENDDKTQEAETQSGGAATAMTAAPLSIIPSSALKALRGVRMAALVPPPPQARTGPPPTAKRARRATIPADVRVAPAAGGSSLELSAVTRDISATGLFLVTETALALGTKVQLRLQLPGDDAFAVSDLELHGHIVRVADNGCGVEFIEPSQAALRLLESLGVHE